MNSHTSLMVFINKLLARSIHC